jgi:hypothetical protein
MITPSYPDIHILDTPILLHPVRKDGLADMGA